MFDVVKKILRVDEEVVKGYLSVGESASVNESLPGKNGAMHSSIKPLWPGYKMCGTALTVTCPAGDNLMMHKAIDMARPGDVLLVTTGGYDEAGGMFGEMMAVSMLTRGCAGLVIEGACRDSGAIRELGLPVFCRNTNVKPTSKALPGTINHDIVIGGILVHPGDLIFGDNDGVIAVPRALAKQVLKTVQTREANEAQVREKILRGEMVTFDLFRDKYAALRLSEEDD